jgi:hypothetical protein
MDIQIKTAGYENIYLDCPFCSTENILNRVSDLDGNNTVSRLDGVLCEKCGKSFDIVGDRVALAKYKWFINELDILKEKKMYRSYALNLCQGLEAFFYQAIINKKFDRNPDFRNEDNRIILEKYNNEGKKYDKDIEEWTFRKMRAEFLTIFKEEQENYIPQRRKPKEDRRCECFRLIKETDINSLRNKVIHKHAYRPSFEEINKYDSLINAIYWLGLYLDVKDSILHLNL